MPLMSTNACCRLLRCRLHLFSDRLAMTDKGAETKLAWYLTAVHGLLLLTHSSATSGEIEFYSCVLVMAAKYCIIYNPNILQALYKCVGGCVAINQKDVYQYSLCSCALVTRDPKYLHQVSSVCGEDHGRTFRVCSHAFVCPDLLPPATFV